MPSCAVSSCPNHTKNSKASMFHFPKDEELCKIWVELCKRLDVVNTRCAVICEEHFEKYQIKGFLKRQLLGVSGTKITLMEGTIPTLNLPSDFPVTVPENATKESRKRPSKNWNVENAYPKKKLKAGSEIFAVRMKLMPVKCAALCCENYKYPCDWISYFTFPCYDRGRCLVWLLNAGRLELAHLPSCKLSRHVLCQKHFEPSQLVRKGPNKRKLVQNAVPTLFALKSPVIPLPLINPSLVSENATEPCTTFKDSIKPLSISADSVKCYRCFKSYRTHLSIMLYFMPVDDDSRYYAWIINSGRPNLLQKSKHWVHQNCLLCSDHFEESQFDSESGFLRAGAIPTLFSKSPRPTIPAPSTFDSSCRKPVPLLIKSVDGTTTGLQSSVPEASDDTGVHAVNVPQASAAGSGAKPSPVTSALLNGTLPNRPNSMQSDKLLNSSKSQSEGNSVLCRLDQIGTRNTPKKSSVVINVPGRILSNHVLDEPPPFLPALQTGPVIVSSSVRSLSTLDKPPASQTPNTTISCVPGPSDTITLLVPVSFCMNPSTQTNPTTTFAGAPLLALPPPLAAPASVFLPIAPNDKPTVSPLKYVHTGSPLLTKASKTVSNVLSKCRPNKIDGPADRQEPLGISQKNMIPTKKGKSKIIVRGNAPITSAQMEAIIKDNFLKSGSVKDGSKISVQLKSSGQRSFDVGGLANETYVVKENKVMSLSSRNKNVESNTVLSGSVNAKCSNQHMMSVELVRQKPTFVSAGGTGPNLVSELRKTVCMQNRKINRLLTLVERLKKEKKEAATNMSMEQLCQLVQRRLPGFPGTFFRTQLKSMRNHKKRQQWDDDTKTFALGMWNRSSAGYKLMRKAFSMPSISALRGWVSTVPTELNFFKKLEEVLLKKATEMQRSVSDFTEAELEVEPDLSDEGESLKPKDGSEKKKVVQNVHVQLEPETEAPVSEQPADSVEVLAEQLVAISKITSGTNVAHS